MAAAVFRRSQTRSGAPGHRPARDCCGCDDGFFWLTQPVSGLLMAPYLIWITFAAALNYSVWLLNSQRVLHDTRRLL
jgi:succinate dehydrogenase hydrophobic anchor subunit